MNKDSKIINLELVKKNKKELVDNNLCIDKDDWLESVDFDSLDESNYLKGLITVY